MSVSSHLSLSFEAGAVWALASVPLFLRLLLLCVVLFVVLCCVLAVAAPGVNLWVRLARRPFACVALYFQAREHRGSLEEYAAPVAAAWRLG